MLFGGTSFGYMAGAGLAKDGSYQSDTTSYDYDAFVTEAGHVREDKYYSMQTLLPSFWMDMKDWEMANRTLEGFVDGPDMSTYEGFVLLENSISLLDVVDQVADKIVCSNRLMSMEEAGGDYGLIMYRHKFSRAVTSARALQMWGVRDVAYVLADGKLVNIIERNEEHDVKHGRLKSMMISAEAKTVEYIG